LPSFIVFIIDNFDYRPINNDYRSRLYRLIKNHPGHEAMVNLMIENGAERDLKDNSGRTTLSRAAANGHKSVVKILQGGSDGPI
jgi:hypothetical protein